MLDVEPISLSSWVYVFPHGLTIVPDLLHASSRDVTELRFQRVQRRGKSLVCTAVQSSHQGSPWEPALHAACLNGRLAIKRRDALAALTGQPADLVALPLPDPHRVVERRVLGLQRSLYFGLRRIMTDVPGLAQMPFVADEVQVAYVFDPESGDVLAIRGLARYCGDPTVKLHLVYDAGDLSSESGVVMRRPDDVLDHLRRTA